MIERKKRSRKASSPAPALEQPPKAPAIADKPAEPQSNYTVARIGMRAEFCLNDSGPKYGTIIHIHEAACIVRLEESRYGKHERDTQDAEFVAALDWDEVTIANVRPSVPSDAHTRPQYVPHVRDWMMDYPPGSNQFDIIDIDEGWKRTVKIATVIVEPQFSAEAAEAIGRMIYTAPKVWRAFRETNRFMLLSDGIEVEEFADNTLLLREAIDEAPYDAPDVRKDDEVDQRNSEKTIDALAKTAKAGKK